MDLDALIESLRQTRQEFGNLPVVSGISRTGYGEPIDRLEVRTVKVMGGDGSQVDVLDLVMSDDSTHES